MLLWHGGPTAATERRSLYNALVLQLAYCMLYLLAERACLSCFELSWVRGRLFASLWVNLTHENQQLPPCIQQRRPPLHLILTFLLSIFKMVVVALVHICRCTLGLRLSWARALTFTPWTFFFVLRNLLPLSFLGAIYGPYNFMYSI